MTQRHKWKKKIDHPHFHVYICTECGCEKDATVLFATIYRFNGEKHFSAPPCPGKQSIANKSEVKTDTEHK